ncbi:MAG: NADPH:quinone oxidoreductase family protein [Actinomycetota bacterium]
MRAVLCSEYGTQDKLSIAEVDDPAAGPGEVVIDIAAASLNFPDLLVIAGLYQFKPDPPFVPGMEGSGTVSGVGQDVTHVNVGDRVMAVGVQGAFADRWVVDAGSVTPIPDDMDFETAAALTLAFGTSYHALKQRAGLQPGETLLILGAAGGVGSSAIEIGKAMGATVIAAASSDEKLEFCRELGADTTINYATEDLKARVREITDGRGADVIYDPVGGELTEQAFRSIAWKGRHLVVGFAAGDIPKIPLNLPLLKGASIVGVFWGSFTSLERDESLRNGAELFQMLSDGILEPRVTNVFPLEEYEAAFDLMASRKATGKVVLRIN